MKNANRIKALFFAVLFSVISVVPVRQSFAIAPVIPLVATAVLTNGVRVALTGAAATGIVTLAGAAISYFTFQAAEKQIQVPAGSYENSKDAIPVPSAPANAQPFGGVPAPDGQRLYRLCAAYRNSSGGWYADCAGWVRSGCAGLGQHPWQYGAWCEVYGDSKRYKGDKYDQYCNEPGCTMGKEAVPAAPSSCPSGYTVTTSGCNLTNPRLAVADDAITYRDDLAGGFEAMEDADAPSDAAYVKPDGSLVVSGHDDEGKAVAITVSPMIDGVRAVNVAAQGSTGSGSPVVQQRDIKTSEAGDVLAVTESAPAPGVVENPGGSTANVNITGQEAQLADIVFPTDYARQGEAAAAAGQVVDAVNNLQSELMQKDNVGDPELPEWVDPWDGAFADLFGWRLPGHNSVCPSMSIDAFGETSVMTSHCQLIEDNRAVLSSVMRVVWTITAFFVILGA